MSELEVTFIDELYQVGPDAELGFGRDAELAIDEHNPFMHRRMGTFVNHRDDWWLRNDARHTELVIVAANGTRIVLVPKAAQVLPGGAGVVRFGVGSLDYELAYTVAESTGPTIPPTSELGVGSGPTASFGEVKLNREQRQLLTALCERQILDPAAEVYDLPANNEIAHRLGWSLRKFDRKLDYLCRRLDEQGVKGLRGRQGEQATDRRRVLAAHVLRSGLIGGDDLPLLEARDDSA